MSAAHHRPARGPSRPPAAPATRALIALAASIPSILALLRNSRDGDNETHLVARIYVRATHNRVIQLDLTLHSTAEWATERALITLGDRRDTARCSLLLNGQPLHPRRTLTHGGVHNSDTLDLVNADTLDHPHSRKRGYARALARLRRKRR